jgi:type I restriction enzyme S subunit
MSSLPKGWKSVLLNEVVDKIVGGGTPSKSIPSYFEGDIPWMTVKDMNKTYLTDTVDHITQEAVENSSTNIIPADTPIIATRMSLGKIVRASFDSAINQDLKALFVNEEVDKYYFELWYRSQRIKIESLGTGTTVKGVRLEVINALVFLLAPLAEQKRIVEKLDEVLAQVDTIKARLDGIPSLLKRFRQSVLASAVSGKLTEEWREENDSKGFELSEFAKFWENEYSKTGKKYSATKAIENSQVSSILPNSWLDTCVGKIFDVHVGATPSRKEQMYWEGDIPWVSSGEVAFSFITETNEKITECGLSNSSTKIHPDGTVMLAMIGQGKTRGQPAILRIEAAHNQNTAALRVPEGMCVSEFLYYCLWEKYEETRRVGSGNNQKALNKSAVQNLRFPCPPYNEQKEIVRLVDQYFAFAETIEAQVKKAQARVNNLTQSILAKAFRGELVPQDPNDEPADKLLERIAQARIEAEALAKATKKAISTKNAAKKKAQKV